MTVPTTPGWLEGAITPADRWVWSPHGVWDSHIQELFTRVHFSTEAVGRK